MTADSREPILIKWLRNRFSAPAQEPPTDGKRWNGSHWVIDGETVVTYRVTWRLIDDGPFGQVYEETFTQQHQGWTFFQQKKRSWLTMDVTWEHVPW